MAAHQAPLSLGFSRQEHWSGLPCPSPLYCLRHQQTSPHPDKVVFWGASGPLEKGIANHSSILAWKIPWTEKPGRLQCMGLWRVGHDWATSLSLFTFMRRRRKWQPTPVFLPGEPQGPGSLVGCHLWGYTKLDTTEVTWQHATYGSTELCHSDLPSRKYL